MYTTEWHCCFSSRVIQKDKCLGKEGKPGLVTQTPLFLTGETHIVCGGQTMLPPYNSLYVDFIPIQTARQDWMTMKKPSDYCVWIYCNFVEV